MELTRECLQKIERLNPVLNAFITVTAETALAQAQVAESEIQRGLWRGPLHGIPVGLKDIIDTAGVRTTAASGLFKDRIPSEDAEVVRLLKAAGTILLGKQNLHECAYGGSSIISYFGEVRNPWDPAYIAGGSSGGSAAAIAAGLCYAAIGTDTGGSIREPASLCGVVGLKPTFARVSVRGVMPLSPSLDHVGPLTSSVADAAAVFEVIAGENSVALAPETQPGNVEIHRMRVGVPRSHFFDGLEPEIAKNIEEALETLKPRVAELREIHVGASTDSSLMAAEAYAYHAGWINESPELYQPETLRRLRSGEKFTAEDRVRLAAELAAQRQRIRAIFEQVDVFITPTVPVSPPTIDELKKDPDALRSAELRLLPNTRPFNIWGLPTISVPCGFTRAGLPIGLQISGPHWGEAIVLSLAQAFEQESGQSGRKPVIL